jgi:ribosomal protein S18 acetylase RimI-like enzyme
MAPCIRRLTADDLDGILQIQAGAYPALAESAATLADRLLQAPDWCWGAEQNGQLRAYLLTHPWPHSTPPEWNTSLPLLPAHSLHLYVHDLAIDVSARGSGLAHPLLGTVLQRARHARFADARLVAVQHSRPFWQRHGFQTVPAQSRLNDTFASYGDDARLMWRRL